MSKKKINQPRESNGVWLKILFITAIVIWASLLLGNWLGMFLVKSNFFEKSKDNLIYQTEKAPSSINPSVADKNTSLPVLSPKVSFGIQIASFGRRENAESLQEDLKKINIQADVLEIKNNDSLYYRLVCGSFESKEQAEAVINLIKGNYKLNPIIYQK